MKLINVHTLKLEEHVGQIPPYAILSHTWGAEEVTLQEWQNSPRPTHKAGFRKILNATRQAELDGLDYLWVDTNCIDKSSSAELSENINSMFVYYGQAAVCYVHLEDVYWTKPVDAESSQLYSQLRASRWFTRGWTLQELLAPRNMVFFAQPWERFGTKSGLLDVLATITGIEEKYLKEPNQIFHTASVAKRMSWASRRQTTRPEDIAYCLLGLFGINLPLLYGEGWRAFLRLQEEIIKAYNDQSIFCWCYLDAPVGWHSFLAPSPREFADSANFTSFREDADTTIQPYTITNAGLSMTVPSAYTCDGRIVVLDVVDNYVDPWGSQRVGIPVTWAQELGCYRRLELPRRPVLIATAMIKHNPRENLYFYCRSRSQAGATTISDDAWLEAGYSLFLTFDVPVTIEWSSDKRLDQAYEDLSESFEFRAHLSSVRTEVGQRFRPTQHRIIVFSHSQNPTKYAALFITVIKMPKREGGGVVWYSEVIPLREPQPDALGRIDFESLVINVLDALTGQNVGGKPMARSVGGFNVTNTGHVSETSAELSRHFPKPILGAGIPILHSNRNDSTDSLGPYWASTQRALHIILNDEVDDMRIHRQVQASPAPADSTLWMPSYSGIEGNRKMIHGVVLRKKQRELSAKLGVMEFWD
ncbi:heterokaryon incompatibility protein domain-containing protein [Trichoderma chlorosporum]